MSVSEMAARADFAMQIGQYAQAIAAFEEVLKLDRNFSSVWGKLAFLYIKEGNSVKAVEAFKKAKLLSDANGGIVTRNATNGLLFP